MASKHEAMLVQSEIVLEEGQWVVYLEVWFEDGIRRQRIDAYRSLEKAKTAARWITWAARRDITPPTGL